MDSSTLLVNSWYGRASPFTDPTSLVPFAFFFPKSPITKAAIAIPTIITAIPECFLILPIIAIMNDFFKSLQNYGIFVKVQRLQPKSDGIFFDHHLSVHMKDRIIGKRFVGPESFTE